MMQVLLAVLLCVVTSCNVRIVVGNEIDTFRMEDRMQIEDFFYKYAEFVDTDNWSCCSALAELFTEDALFSYNVQLFGVDISHHGDVLSTMKWLKDRMEYFESIHSISNVQVNYTSESTATARAILYNPMNAYGFRYITVGRYQHELVKADSGRWKSSSLVNNTTSIQMVLTIEQIVFLFLLFIIYARCYGTSRTRTEPRMKKD